MALVNKIKGIDRSSFFYIFKNKSISNLLQVLENGSLLCPGHISRLPLFAQSFEGSLFILTILTERDNFHPIYVTAYWKFLHGHSKE